MVTIDLTFVRRALTSLAVTAILTISGWPAAQAQSGQGGCCKSMSPAACIAACADDNDATRPACCPADPAARKACIQKTALNALAQAQAKRDSRMARLRQAMARTTGGGSGATVSGIPYERQAPLPMGIIESDNGAGVFEYEETVRFTYTANGSVRTVRYSDTSMVGPGGPMEYLMDTMAYNAQGKLIFYESRELDPFTGPLVRYRYVVREANNRPISATSFEDDGSGQLVPFMSDSLIYAGNATLPNRIVRNVGGGFGLTSDSLRFAPGTDLYDMLFNVGGDGSGISEPYRGLTYERLRIAFGPISLTVGRRYVVTRPVGANVSRRHLIEEARTPPQQGYFLSDGTNAQVFTYNPQGLLSAVVFQEYDSIPRLFNTLDSSAITYVLNAQGQYTQATYLFTDPQGTFTDVTRLRLMDVTSTPRRTPVSGKLSAYYEGGRLVGVGTLPAGQLRLTDAAGRVVNTSAHTGGEWSLPAYSLPAGVYTVEWVSRTSGERRRSRLVLGQ